MTVYQNIRIAMNSIRGNLTRTVITCLIIAIGIMALVGMLTAIDGVESSMVRNFSFMGANSFNIQNRSSGFEQNSKRVHYPVITYREASEFKDRFELPGEVSVNNTVSFTAVAKYMKEKSNPNMGLIGGDENYLTVAGYTLAEGRNLTTSDVERNLFVTVIGQEVKETLFGNDSPLEQTIRVGGVKLRVIGVVEEKGGAFDFGGDRLILIPVTLGRSSFAQSSANYTVSVSVPAVEAMDPTTDYAESLFRQIRKRKVKQVSNFRITKSDAIISTLMESVNYLIIGAVVIAGITLAGAAIALMNIMLVSVTERTREIGTRKAIGARRGSIMGQFVVEAITICQLGGIAGVILGIVTGNLVSSFIGGEFIIPWDWIGMALLVCTVVGMSAGIWPAYKASKIDPIEALRHE